jgi:hypothetical protein
MHTIQISMHWVGFEPMISAFERVKTFHALDRAATVIGGSGYVIQIYLTSALVRGEWSASRSCRFTPGVTTHWIGSWVDLSAGLDDVEKRKFLILPGLELFLDDEIRLHGHTQMFLSVLCLASSQVLNCPVCWLEYSREQPSRIISSYLHYKFETMIDLPLLSRPIY